MKIDIQVDKKKLTYKLIKTVLLTIMFFLRYKACYCVHLTQLYRAFTYPYELMFIVC